MEYVCPLKFIYKEAFVEINFLFKRVRLILCTNSHKVTRELMWYFRIHKKNLSVQGKCKFLNIIVISRFLQRLHAQQIKVDKLCSLCVNIKQAWISRVGSGRVNCCYTSPAYSFLGSGPARPTAIFFCLTTPEISSINPILLYKQLLRTYSNTVWWGGIWKLSSLKNTRDTHIRFRPSITSIKCNTIVCRRPRR
jgi:hypothetical protein